MLYYTQKEKLPLAIKGKAKNKLEVNTMSEKLFLIITGVLGTVSALGPCFFGMNFMIGLVLCLIPLLLVPTLRFAKN